ncbi:MAG: beta-N-acetylhexosaminidase, partial [Gammaproteobacteria bacterium]|nr:beta-N-acetylhexosaminidase [Gammaproteobacteria bacterium]
MKLMLTLLTLATVLPLTFQSSAAPLPLMPYPATVKSAPGYFSTEIRQSGPAVPLTVSLPADFPAELAAKSQYLLAHLSQRLSAQAGREVPVLLAKDKSKALLQIEFQQLITLPQPGDDESYQLQIKAQQIQLQAKNSTGVLYGLETLAQLLDCTVQPCQLPLVQITDQPRFSWRGLMLDSARRFIPLPDLKRQLQGMASARLNVLHWHLTDDQGWRFASNHYPRLTELETAGEFYSQQQMRELVAYAAKLGIRVVPELDFPGHASTIARAYPQLMAAAGPYAAERGFGVFAPVLDVSSSQVAEFIEKLLTEVVQIFPDPYLHIGGDEVKPDHWLANSAIQQYMQQNNLPDAAALHADFNLRLARQLTSLNRRMMGWDEVLHKDLPLSVLVQSWQGQDAVAASVRAGHPTLLSAGYYLDQPMPTSFHYRNDPVGVAQPLPQLTATSALQLEFSLLRLNNKPVQGQMLLVPATVDKRSDNSDPTPPQVRL